MTAERSSKAVAQAQAFLGVRFSLCVPVAFFSFTARQSFTPNHLSIRARVRVKDQAGTRRKLLNPRNIRSSSVAPAYARRTGRSVKSWNRCRDGHDGPWPTFNPCGPTIEHSLANCAERFFYNEDVPAFPARRMMLPGFGK